MKPISETIVLRSPGNKTKDGHKIYHHNGKSVILINTQDWLDKPLNNDSISDYPKYRYEALKMSILKYLKNRSKKKQKAKWNRDGFSFTMIDLIEEIEDDSPDGLEFIHDMVILTIDKMGRDGLK